MWLTREIIIFDVQSGSVCTTLRGPPVWIRSVAFSPDGRFLVSGADNGNIYIHDLESNERDDAEARWIAGCSQMDPQDGWVKDCAALLLWVPGPHRGDVRFCARRIMSDQPPSIETYSIDYETLLTRYSGSNWTDIFSDFDD